MASESEQGPRTPLGSPSKRRRILVDPHATPTPAPHTVAPSDSASQAPSLTSSTSATSLRSSGRSSPTKQFGRLELHNPLKIHFDDFDGVGTDLGSGVNVLPPGLQEVRRQLAAFSINQNIIPRRDQAAVASLLQGSPYPITDAAYYDDEEPFRVGPIVSLSDISTIVKASRRCRADRAAEIVWNVEVHQEMLRRALRKNLCDIESGTTNFTICTSASIHNHVAKRSSTKMIDFCLYIDTDVLNHDEPGVAPAVERLRARSPTESVNHTGFATLRKHPVALSIESKKSDGSQDEAILQIGTWQAAQFLFLSKMQAAKGRELQGLEFLPGLIVQGADWHFVAATRRGDETIVWTKQPIGSTTSPLGTYQVIRSIQYLAWWCQEVYWTWFAQNMLDLVYVEEALPSAVTG
ncbi:uncharacterized protein CTRU02_215822 [Colletotrichum truncatum]|uniref:Uncharacterized protein n=1 Tax=Colletotrichum truncatum TaxID=5467 RepID=A0ACC3YBI6_COLTU